MAWLAWILSNVHDHWARRKTAKDGKPRAMWLGGRNQRPRIEKQP